MANKDKDKLIQVNRWNMPLFTPEGNSDRRNIYSGIDFTQTSQQMNLAGVRRSDLAPAAEAIKSGSSSTSSGGFNMNGSLAKGILGGLGVASGGITGLISNGYSTGGVGEGISTVGNLAGDALMASGIGAPIGLAVKFGSAVLGGLANRIGGIKKNDENIKAVEGNVSKANDVSNLLNSSASTNDLLNNSSQMVSSLGLNSTDLVEGGWSRGAKRRARKEARKYLNKEALALNNQSQSLSVGAYNVDQNMDDNLSKNFVFAYGGPIGNPINNTGMGAIDYGFMSDYLTNYKARQQKQDNITNMFAGTPTGIFALGGDLQTHGADWSTGATTVNAGGTHEENPYEGVQMGVDPEGTPNLVEEGEMVYNDYVYSNRIPIDEATKQKFHIGKKREMTYADLAKKLEKEIAERPNDPISKAGFKVQMGQLAEEQERQKQEMEAERAKEAFEALSPEEQVQAMQMLQQAEDEEQMTAQQQAIQEQQAAQQMNPEEMAMMQQPMQEEMIPQGMPMQEDYAYGGNLFGGGGALDWLKTHHPELGTDMAEVAKAMENLAKSKKSYGISVGLNAVEGVDSNTNFVTSRTTRSGVQDWTKTYLDITRNGFVGNTINYISQKDINKNKKLYTKLRNAGLSHRLAAKYAFPKPKDNSFGQIDIRNQVIKELEKGNTSVQASTQSIQNKEIGTNGKKYKTREEANAASTYYKALDGKIYNTKEEAFEANKPILRARSQSTSSGNKVVEGREAAQQQTSRDNTNGGSGARRQGAPVAIKGNVNSLNTGEWNGSIDNPWQTFVRPGFEQYLAKQEAALFDPTLTSEQKAALRQQIANEINGIQESYYTNVAPTFGQANVPWSKGVEEHQQLFDRMGGNAGFVTIDENGQPVYSIEDAITKPQGADTPDKVGGTFVDGYNGRKTNIRYWGATGDDVEAIRQRLANIGIDFSANKDWTFGNDGRQLYKASLIGAAPQDAAATEDDYNYLYRPDDGEKSKLVETPWQSYAQNPAVSTSAATSDKEPKLVVEPNYKADWLRYAGLLGPAVGLGMQALGIGRPDTKGLDASLDILKNVATVSPEHIGGYYAYRPDDPFFDEIQAGGANAATIRGGINNAAPIGNQQAFILAADNNFQNNVGRRRREGQRYNNAERLTALHEQKDTDKWNVGTDNEFAKYNADTINRNAQLRAQLGMQAAAQKMDADAAWYNGIYGNVGGIFKGIGDLGRENAEHNMIAEMAANGIFGKMTPQTKVGKRGRYLTWRNDNSAAKGGKLNKKGRK